MPHYKHNETPSMFHGQNNTVSRAICRPNLLIYRTLHNNTMINKIVSRNINLMFHDLIFI